MRKSSTGSASVSKRQRKELNSPLLKVLGTWQREGDRPTRVRTWASKGQTPVIQFHFNWKHISVIAGVSHTQCLLRMYEGSIKKEQHAEFLKALRAHLKRPRLIIWDGLKAHRSKLVCQ